MVDGDRLPTFGRAVVVHSPRDGRLVFVLPAGRRTIIGTTETDWPGAMVLRGRRGPRTKFAPTRRDVDYLLETANHAFPPAALQPSDVISTFAGLRPLIDRGLATHAATSREHAIWSDARGWLHVAGGKLTTMRSMAEEVVDRAIEMLRDRGLGRASAALPDSRTSPARGRKGQVLALRLWRLTSSRTSTKPTGLASIRSTRWYATDASLGRELDPDLPYLAAELVFAIRSDLACEVEDVLRRRVPLALVSKTHGLDLAEETADLLARERGWSEQRRTQSLLRYRTAVSASRAWQSD